MGAVPDGQVQLFFYVSSYNFSDSYFFAFVWPR